MTSAVPYRLDSTLRFVINAASGRNAADAKREVIETALREAGRPGELLFVPPPELAGVARREAAAAAAEGGAIVAVGGDGTINAVAQAAHAVDCTMGVLPQGTFNYFARTNGIPTEPSEAARALLEWTPQPVQVGSVNGHVFLVNASLGLYPELLEDREAYKARFGRSRLVAFGAAIATLLGEHRRMRLNVERSDGARQVRTQTLFVGNNRLQLEQVGLPQAPALDHGRIAAVMLKPIGSLAMLGLLLRGAMGRLGDADTVESFAFRRMVVKPSWRPGRRGVKIACDGEILWMRPPLTFLVEERPLQLLKPVPAAGTRDTA